MRGCIYLEWKENHHQCMDATQGSQIPLEDVGVTVSEMTATLARAGDKRQKKDKSSLPPPS